MCHLVPCVQSFCCTQWAVLVQLASKLLHALFLKPGNSFLFGSEALILLTKTPIDKCVCFAQLSVFNQKGLLPLQCREGGAMPVGKVSASTCQPV